MPNTKSAKKAVRSSNKKQLHNLFWKKRFKIAIKSLKRGLSSKEPTEILEKKLLALQKVLDKSAKEKVIHKNKANRLKSRYAQQVSSLVKKAKPSKEGK